MLERILKCTSILPLVQIIYHVEVKGGLLSMRMSMSWWGCGFFEKMLFVTALRFEGCSGIFLCMFFLVFSLVSSTLANSNTPATLNMQDVKTVS